MMIIDYKTGNLRNIQKIIESMNEVATIGNSVDEINNASSYILPGVGAFDDAMSTIIDLGIIEALRYNVLIKKKPILGICLGMQLLGARSDEGKPISGLCFLDMAVKKIKVSDGLRLPHIGWNNLHVRKKALLFKDLPEDSDLYFVHSYHAVCNDPNIIAATCNYGQEIVVAVEKGNVHGMQFHPEKSQHFGRILINNFINYCQSESAL